ncbi:MAG: DNRLRE domain-containing protein [Planctomycetota bacterium]
MDAPYERRTRHARHWRLPWVAAVVLAVLGSPADAQTITLPASAAGLTPRVIGLNSGNYLPGSNTTTWWKWSGVNGARIFTSAPRIEPEDDQAPFGDGVTSSNQFQVRRFQLRNDPLNPTFNNFAHFAGNYATNESDFINYQYAYGQLSANGVQPLAMINRTNNRYPFAADGAAQGWGDRWEHWQHYYAQAFYLAQNFDVERYSMYNEPDQSSQTVTQEDYLLRLQLASDAIQSAVADVNQMFGKQLNAQVLAPITAGSDNEYFRRLDNSDTRDDTTGWGELVINNLNTNFLGQVDPNFQLIHTYAYQQYNASGRGYAEDLDRIKGYVADDLAANNLEGDIDFGLTEFNVHSNGVFSGRSDTLDTPSRYARLGGIFTGLANEQADELYLFKFSSNAEEQELQKNAVFYNSRFDAPYNTGGASAAAGVLKLFTKGFVGAQTLLEEPTHEVSGLDIAASYHADRDYFYALSANESTQSRSLDFDLSVWGVEPGSVVQVEEVRQGSLAETTHRITVPANQTINLTQAAESVLLLSTPRTAPDRQLTLLATNDAMVKAANNASRNYGGSDNLVVKNVADSPNGRNVSFVQFDTSAVGDDSIERAVLQLYGENLGTDDFATAHVYAVLGDNWDEDTITWDTATNLADTQSPANLIAHNFVTGIGDSAEFVGHLTVDDTLRQVSLDVTDILLQHPDDEVTFLIAREVRFDGENVDESVSHLRFASKDRPGDFGPRLLLDLRDAPATGDYNGDGLVDVADYLLWRSTFASEADLRADGNADGVVDTADFTIWRDAFSAAAGGTATPEPATLTAIAAAAMLAGRRRAKPLRLGNTNHR